jgi:histidyl-tRNA synthetase
MIGSLGSQESRGAYRAKLQAYLREHEDQLSAEVRDRIDLNPLRAFDADDRGTQAVMRDAPRLLDDLDAEDRDHFEQVKQMLDAVDIAYEIDTTLVRGLDYYTRTLFEFTSSVLDGKGVGGGGRYDGLMEQLGGPPTPGCGWGAGVERMIMTSQQAAVGPPPVDLYVAAAEPDQRVAAFKLASDARRTGHPAQVELAGRSIKGIFKHADRIGARYVAVLGPDGVALKDLESGEQQTVNVESIMHHIRGNQI